MTKPVLYCIDGNWVLHRLYFASQKWNPTSHQLASSILSSICKDAITVNAKNIVVAFDGSEVFRQNLYPDYKANRKTESKMQIKNEIYSYLNVVKDFLKESGLIVIHKKCFEADDVLASIAKHHSNKYKIVIGSRDKDMYQCIRNDITMYDSAYWKKGIKEKGRIIDEQMVKVITKLTPEQFLQQQILTGDPVDNIPRIMTKGKANKGLRTHNSLNNWISKDKRFKNLLKENLKHFKLNKKLVTLYKDIKITINDFHPNINSTNSTYQRWISTLT